MTITVKPVVAVLYRDDDPKDRARQRLQDLWGEIDFESKPLPFDVTDYYAKEMGEPLHRLFWSFSEWMQADTLSDYKQQSIEVEKDLSVDGRRQINLDPGYMDPCKLVLASLKYNGPKVYLRDGIYADVMLLYDKGVWKPTPWSFPDFQDGRYDPALSSIRGKMRANRPPNP